MIDLPSTLFSAAFYLKQSVSFPAVVTHSKSSTISCIVYTKYKHIRVNIEHKNSVSYNLYYIQPVDMKSIASEIFHASHLSVHMACCPPGLLDYLDI